VPEPGANPCPSSKAAASCSPHEQRQPLDQSAPGVESAQESAPICKSRSRGICAPCSGVRASSAAFIPTAWVARIRRDAALPGIRAMFDEARQELTAGRHLRRYGAMSWPGRMAPGRS
jgi:hypothetical protein